MEGAVRALEEVGRGCTAEERGKGCWGPRACPCAPAPLPNLAALHHFMKFVFEWVCQLHTLGAWVAAKEALAACGGIHKRLRAGQGSASSVGVGESGKGTDHRHVTLYACFKPQTAAYSGGDGGGRGGGGGLCLQGGGGGQASRAELDRAQLSTAASVHSSPGCGSASNWLLIFPVSLLAAYWRLWWRWRWPGRRRRALQHSGRGMHSHAVRPPICLNGQCLQCGAPIAALTGGLGEGGGLGGGGGLGDGGGGLDAEDTELGSASERHIVGCHGTLSDAMTCGPLSAVWHNHTQRCSSLTARMQASHLGGGGEGGRGGGGGERCTGLATVKLASERTSAVVEGLPLTQT